MFGAPAGWVAHGERVGRARARYDGGAHRCTTGAAIPRSLGTNVEAVGVTAAGEIRTDDCYTETLRTLLALCASADADMPAPPTRRVR